MKIVECDEEDHPGLELKNLKPGDIFKMGDGALGTKHWDLAAFYLYCEAPKRIWESHLFVNLTNGQLCILPYGDRSLFNFIRYQPVGEWKVRRE